MQKRKKIVTSMVHNALSTSYSNLSYGSSPLVAKHGLESDDLLYKNTR